MSNKLYEENDIQNIANAIRNKNGTEDTYKVSQMSTAIDSIEVIEQATAEGESISLTNTKAMPYSDYVVKGKSEQDGTPSPSIPSEIHSVADDVNLLNIDNVNQYTFQCTYNKTNNKIEIISTAQTGVSYCVLNPKIKFEPNTTYTVSFDYTGDLSKTLMFSDNYTGFGNASTTNIFNFTTTSSIYELALGIYPITGSSIEVSNIKIQKGTTTTPYSPYNQGTVTIKQRGTTENNNYTFQTEPLRSLPNGVKDTIEADGIHRRVGRIVLDENNINIVTNFGYRNNMPRVYILKTNLGYKTSWDQNICLMNKYKEINAISSIATGTFASNFTQNYVEIFNENFTDLETAKGILLGTEISCQLAEEVIEPLTQNQATTMLDIIKTGSYEGTTNIYTDEDVKPTIGVGYYKKS